ncbi:hypothetical protein DVH05_011666 [Phytophthora capsici]|nr:hypothetical protein DVH05_011666 [Phytophthora capsici]
MQSREGGEVGAKKVANEFPQCHLNREYAESTFKAEQLKRSRNVETWNTKCVAEEENFEQHGRFVKISNAYAHDTHVDILLASRFEYEFSKALQSTDHLGVPNPLRTAICFDVLAKINSRFPRFQALTSVTRTELERSTYMKEPQPSVLHRDLFSVENAGRLTSESLKESLLRRAYFTELKEVLAEKESLEQHL